MNAIVQMNYVCCAFLALRYCMQWYPDPDVGCWCSTHSDPRRWKETSFLMGMKSDIHVRGKLDWIVIILPLCVIYRKSIEPRKTLNWWIECALCGERRLCANLFCSFGNKCLQNENRFLHKLFYAILCVSYRVHCTAYTHVSYFVRRILCAAQLHVTTWNALRCRGIENERSKWIERSNNVNKKMKKDEESE